MFAATLQRASWSWLSPHPELLTLIRASYLSVHFRMLAAGPESQSEPSFTESGHPCLPALVTNDCFPFQCSGFEVGREVGVVCRCFAFHFSASPQMLLEILVSLGAFLSTPPALPVGPRVGMTNLFEDRRGRYHAGLAEMGEGPG